MARNTGCEGAFGAVADLHQSLIVPSVEAKTPVRQARELERSPSPFIKKEKEDQNVYSSHLLQEYDDHEYEPPQTFALPIRPALGKRARSPTPEYYEEPVMTMPPRRDDQYDPANLAISPQQSATYDITGPLFVPSNDDTNRKLSESDGNLFEPQTVCFTEVYRNEPLVHVLNCHGEVTTNAPQACDINCKLTKEAESKADGCFIQCTHPACVQKRESRQSSIFLPKRKRARTAAPAADARMMPPPAIPSQAPRRSSRLKTYDDVTAELNQKVISEPGYAALAAQAQGPGVRERSKKHPGYAGAQELKDDREAQRLFDITGGLDVGLDNKPKVKREMRKLRVEGTDKLRGMGGAFGLRRNKQAEAAAFAAHDKPLGAEDPKDKPWSYANSKNAKPGRRAIRNEEAGTWSMPKTRYDDMLKEENGVVIEREDTVSQRLPRTQDGYDVTQGEVVADICVVCEEENDRAQEECTQCHDRFHRACIGKPEYDVDPDADGFLYNGPWECDQCDAKMPGSRVVCRHPDCFHFDYCTTCAVDKAQDHAEEVAIAGNDPQAHRFVEVEGPLGPALKAIEDAEQGEFVCSDCVKNQKQAAQDKANRMLGPKNVNVSQLRAELKRLDGFRKKQMKEQGFKETMEKRIADNRQRHTSHRLVLKSRPMSSASTPQRRSTRSQGNAFGLGRPQPQASLETVNEADEDTEMGGVALGDEKDLFGE